MLFLFVVLVPHTLQGNIFHGPRYYIFTTWPEIAAGTFYVQSVQNRLLRVLFYFDCANTRLGSTVSCLFYRIFSFIFNPKDMKF